jgi:hypothetical protein
VKEGGEKETGDELEAGVVKEDIRPLDLGQKLRSIWESEREKSGGVGISKKGITRGWSHCFIICSFYLDFPRYSICIISSAGFKRKRYSYVFGPLHGKIFLNRDRRF